MTELILRGVFTLRRSELDWYYNGGAGHLHPERYAEFRRPIGGTDFTGDAIAAYAGLLFDPDPAVHLPAAAAWSTWEAGTITLGEDPDPIVAADDPRFALAFARIENHYFRHGGWFTDGQLIADAGRLAGIPGIIVQGRYDLVTPAVTAWELARVWRGVNLQIIPAAGHTGTEPGNVSALIDATDRFADRATAPFRPSAAR